ncbi:hypothetical protein Pint_33087 [Pistacia integerrima]|uniref:Uncharacterized protein n=1 Tax=Pistacia integerrima TaxID=434235 RepID=A0ACC0X5D0_9ROSI|nr:hypothetical protein Pint_33087 [Pistacia integerrima]
MAAVVSYCKPSPFLGRSSPSLTGKSPCRQPFRNQVQRSQINALFWGSKKSVEQQVLDFSVVDFTITGSEQEGATENQGTSKKIYLSVISSILEVSANEWDACALDTTGPEKFNPFLTHGFLSSLEETGCAVKETGWTPCHIVAKDESQNILGVVPLYLKSHSYGEFVFDHAWADAYYSYGMRYYPKFQCCVPFTPVTGPRILIRNTLFKDQVLGVIISVLKDLTAKMKYSNQVGNHFYETRKKFLVFICCILPAQSDFISFDSPRFHHYTLPSHLKMSGINSEKKVSCRGLECSTTGKIVIIKDSFCSFDEFLMDMKQSKRKNIRQERKKIPAQNLTMKRLRGYEIKARHWDSFYQFYRNTTDNKWGSPYLTRDFFHNMGSKMGADVLLVVAEEGDELVAGALNLIGGDTLFGRLWGCHPGAYYPSLHFEACYYQAIEAAIELDLNTVEAGAQGEHKLQRGYMPVTTYSCHYLVDESFRKPIEEFLVREATQVRLVMKLLQDSGPFKDGIEG